MRRRAPQGQDWSTGLPRALITGLTGQDGSYLAEFLLFKGYEVHGLVRKASSFNTPRVSHLYVDPHRGGVSFFIHYAELSDTGRLSPLVAELQPDEIYHLGAQSHVRVSFDIPEYTCDITGLGSLRVLEAIRRSGIKCKFYQASSSEMFGASPPPQCESTPFYPRSPYAAAKVFSYWATVNYREAYDIFAANGILFNHESPRRGETFVTRKITRAVANIKAGTQGKLYLGNLDARRDWGFAPEYVECQWLILQQDRPGDYVIGTGQSHTVREFVQAAFSYADLDWREHVEIDARYLRPTEVDNLQADISKARTQLGWAPRVTFDELVKIMVDSDLRSVGLQPPGAGERALRDKQLDWFDARHLARAEEETMAHCGSFR
jgi:GDPmannose 4,6-dehydratase